MSGFDLNLHLLSYSVPASSKGSGDAVCTRWFAGVFTGRQQNKYQNLNKMDNLAAVILATDISYPKYRRDITSQHSTSADHGLLGAL